MEAGRWADSLSPGASAGYRTLLGGPKPLGADKDKERERRTIIMLLFIHYQFPIRFYELIDWYGVHAERAFMAYHAGR